MTMNIETQKEKMLALMRDYKPHSNGEFVYGLRIIGYKQRIFDLRKDGYDIPPAIKNGSKFEWTLQPWELINKRPQETPDMFDKAVNN